MRRFMRLRSKPQPHVNRGQLDHAIWDPLLVWLRSQFLSRVRRRRGHMSGVVDWSPHDFFCLDAGGGLAWGLYYGRRDVDARPLSPTYRHLLLRRRGCGTCSGR